MADHISSELSVIWKTFLNVDSVQPEDNFFDLGGRSIQAMGAMIYIREAFGINLGYESLFDAPTFESMADLIRQNADPRTMSPLTMLSEGGSGLPLFCIHSVTGDLVSFRYLLQEVDLGRPVYGFRAVEASESGHELTTVPQMADQYIDLMRSVQPTGPYLLAGNCLGGLIAVEMGLRLSTVDERVAFLGVLDAPTSYQRSAVGKWLPDDGTANPRLGSYRAWTYPGSITLFIATLGPFDSRSLEGQWKSVTKGNLTVIEIEAIHDDIAESPVFGDALRECLDKVDPRPDRLIHPKFSDCG